MTKRKLANKKIPRGYWAVVPFPTRAAAESMVAKIDDELGYRAHVIAADKAMMELYLRGEE